MTTPQPAGARVGSSPNRARRRWIVGASAVALGLLAVLGVVVIVPLVNVTSPPPAIAENVLAGDTNTVWSVSTTQLDGRPVIVSGSDDKTVRVWDLASGAPVGQPLTGHTYPVQSVATAQLDGRPVIISGGSDDKTVRVWDLATGAPIGRPITGHTREAYSVATAQLDGRPVIISGSRDMTVRVWDLATGAPIGRPLTGHTSAVWSVATAQLDGRPVIRAHVDSSQAGSGVSWVGCVKSTWGAVPVSSTGPFPQAASRTRRARFRAPGAPQVLLGFRLLLSPRGGPRSRDDCSPVSVACRAHLGRIEQ